jgi:hypothetical protein
MAALEPVASRHNKIPELVTDIFEEDPFAALGLLHVCGVNMFGHILSVVLLGTPSGLCVQRDSLITAGFGAIHGLPVDLATSTHDLPVVAGGAGLHSLSRTTSNNYLGAFFHVEGPLIDRL